MKIINRLNLRVGFRERFCFAMVILLGWEAEEGDNIVIKIKKSKRTIMAANGWSLI